MRWLFGWGPEDGACMGRVGLAGSLRRKSGGVGLENPAYLFGKFLVSLSIFNMPPLRVLVVRTGPISVVLVGSVPYLYTIIKKILVFYLGKIDLFGHNLFHNKFIKKFLESKRIIKIIIEDRSMNVKGDATPLLRFLSFSYRLCRS
jgi:hypothetical protein